MVNVRFVLLLDIIRLKPNFINKLNIIKIYAKVSYPTLVVPI